MNNTPFVKALKDTEMIFHLHERIGLEAPKAVVTEPRTKTLTYAALRLLRDTVVVSEKLGFSIKVCGDDESTPYTLQVPEEDQVVRDAERTYDPVGTADALGDLIYVAKGAGLALGVSGECIRNSEPLEDTLSIREFMEACGQDVHDSPLNPAPRDVRHLRARLIVEEVLEFLDEGARLLLKLGDGEAEKIHPKSFVLEDIEGFEYDSESVHAALIAIIGNTKQTAITLGIPLDEVILEVIHASNMSKLGEDGKPIIDEHGKVRKGPNFFEPDIEPVLRKYT